MPADRARPALPEGDVTFLFTDIEGSTRLLERFGDRLTSAMALHHELLTDAVATHGGVVFETVGDAVYAAFPRPLGGVQAAAAAHRAMAAQDWGDLGAVRVRIAVHRGEVERRGAHYLGPALFRAARILALAHGGQTLVSAAIAGAVAGDLPPDLGLRALGRHRLRDLVEPEEVWQVTGDGLLDGFPPLRAVDARTDVLPRPVSSLVGRTVELAGVEAALAGSRLVTLVATGGTGKSRLAIEVGHRVRERFRDGVAFVDLSPIRAAPEIPGALAAVLGLRPIGDEPSAATLGRWVAERELLLILDNLEQIPGAGRVVGSVLEGAGGLRVLATSRERLGVRGERVVNLDPLPAERPPGGQPSEAELLFLDRAGRTADDLAADEREALPDIVRRLDGLPLAIEIAAARAGSIALPMLRGLLERRLPGLTGPVDLPDRQRTLQDTITWSVGLLSAEASAVFRGLSTFPSRWPASAVAPVVAPELDPDDVLLLLALLVEKCLVRSAGTDPFGEPCYSLLETTRQVATGMVGPEESAALRDRHAAWVVALVERAEPAMVGDDATRWVDLLEQQRFDLEAAVEHALRTDDPLTAQHITGAAWRAGWLRAGMMASLAELSRRAVEAPGDTPASVRGRALTAYAALGQSVTAPEVIGAVAREAVDLLVPLGPTGDLAEAWCTLGSVHANHGRLDGVLEAMSHALDTWQQIGHARGQITALHNLAGLHAELGDLPAALDALEQAEAIGRAAGIRVATDEALNAVDTLLQAGLVDRAAERLRQIAASGVRWGQDVLLDAGFVALTARVVLRRGRPEVAIRIEASARASMQRLGFHPDFIERLVVDPLLSAAPPPETTEEGRPLPDAQGFALLRAEGAAISLEAAVGQALEALRETSGTT